MTQPKMNEEQVAYLAEMLEFAKITEQKARELNEQSIAFEEKWKCRLKSREESSQQAAQNF